jgi:virginiamycin A acetyltransferase
MNRLPDSTKVYPRSNDTQTIYLKNVVNHPNIRIGDYTIYNDFKNDPRDFQKNNVLYHFPGSWDKLTIGKFCSVACGARFLMNISNHTLKSLSTYPFPLFGEEWSHDLKLGQTWDFRGDIVVGNDVWIGYEAVILSGVTIGDGAIIGTRALVNKDVQPYTIVGGMPAKPIRKRYPDSIIEVLLSLKWWNWPEERIQKALPFIQTGDIESLQKV